MIRANKGADPSALDLTLPSRDTGRQEPHGKENLSSRGDYYPEDGRPQCNVSVTRA